MYEREYLMRLGPTVCVLILFSLYTVGTVRLASVWQSELTLWLQAVEQAPQKPRPHLQLALALMERQRFFEAQIVLDDTATILKTNATILPWDRRETEAALLQNRSLLRRITGSGMQNLGR